MKTEDAGGDEGDGDDDDGDGDDLKARNTTVWKMMVVVVEKLIKVATLIN